MTALLFYLFDIIVKALLVGYGRKELACCVESLEFDLGLKSVLRLHHHINHLETIIVPFPDAPEVPGPALVVDDEGHDTVEQAFLEYDKSTHAVITVFEGKDLLEPHMEIHDLIPLDFGLVLIFFRFQNTSN